MDIKSLIENYQTPVEAVELVKNSKILLLVGVSGAGKDTVKRELLRLDSFNEIISHTTRVKRLNDGVIEKDGVDYHFVDEAQARDMLLAKQFIEAKLVHGNTVYGTSIAAVRQASQAGVALTDLDVQGVREYKQISPAVVAVFIAPPSFEEWLRRLKRRYATEEEFNRDWAKRRRTAIQELEEALESHSYHYIINDNLDQSIAEIQAIMADPKAADQHDAEAHAAAKSLLYELKA